MLTCSVPCRLERSPQAAGSRRCTDRWARGRRVPLPRAGRVDLEHALAKRRDRRRRRVAVNLEHAVRMARQAVRDAVWGGDRPQPLELARQLGSDQTDGAGGRVDAQHAVRVPGHAVNDAVGAEHAAEPLVLAHQRRGVHEIRDARVASGLERLFWQRLRRRRRVFFLFLLGGLGRLSTPLLLIFGDAGFSGGCRRCGDCARATARGLREPPALPSAAASLRLRERVDVGTISAPLCREISCSNS